MCHSVVLFCNQFLEPNLLVMFYWKMFSNQDIDIPFVAKVGFSKSLRVVVYQTKPPVWWNSMAYASFTPIFSSTQLLKRLSTDLSQPDCYPLGDLGESPKLFCSLICKLNERMHLAWWQKQSKCSIMLAISIMCNTYFSGEKIFSRNCHALGYSSLVFAC